MLCPRCRTPLEAHQAPRLLLHGCHACGGLFLDGAASQRVVAAIDPDALAAADQASREARARVDESAPAACPSCGRAMQRVEIAQARVAVDACAEHGVWFDRDELSRVIRAVAPQRTTPVPMAPANPPANVPVPVPASAPAPAPAPAWDTPAARFFSPTNEQAAPPPQPNAMPFAQPQPQPPASPSPAAPGSPAWDTPAARFFTPDASAPAQPGSPLTSPLASPSQWSTGQKVLAAGVGVAAVGGLAYAATHTDTGRGLVREAGREVFGDGGISGVGATLSKLFE